MKKLLLLAFVGLFAFGMTSCKKDPTEKLIGTWNYHEEESEYVSDYDMTIGMVIDVNLGFVDEATGNMETYVHMTVDGETFVEETVNQGYTYTFDGLNGTISVPETTLDNGTTVSAQNMTFTLVDDTHISVTNVDEETGETETVTFTKK